MKAPVLIVGGGLAGLIAARLLHRAGITFQLIEARDRLGGRILSMEGCDLGPSWFWPEMQPGFANFVHELGVDVSPQFDTGDLVIQRGQGRVQRYPARRQEPRSMRPAGGMAALIDRLACELPVAAIRLNAQVTAMMLGEEGVEVTIESGEILAAAHVLLAMPPRLLATQIRFVPPMPSAITQLWLGIPTWMAPHAKLVAVYDRPFWRDVGLSGTAQSQIGPLVEIHDATTSDGKAALFGFVGVPAPTRLQVGEAAVIAAAVSQLGELFGSDASHPVTTHYKDWAADSFTSAPDDLFVGDHLSPVRLPWVAGPWAQSLTLIGTETSQTEPGYLAGALEAAERGTATLVARLAA